MPPSVIARVGDGRNVGALGFGASCGSEAAIGLRVLGGSAACGMLLRCGMLLCAAVCYCALRGISDTAEWRTGTHLCMWSSRE